MEMEFRCSKEHDQRHESRETEETFISSRGVGEDGCGRTEMVYSTSLLEELDC